MSYERQKRQSILGIRLYLLIKIVGKKIPGMDVLGIVSYTDNIAIYEIFGIIAASFCIRILV